MKSTQMAIGGLGGLALAARTKILHFLTSLFRKTQDTVTDSAPAPANKLTARSGRASNPNPDLRPVSVRKQLGQQNGNGNSVELWLDKILAELPLELQPRIRKTNVGEQTISVPVEKILAQISRGIVKITFGELRQAAPGVFTTDDDQDWMTVTLPLADILSQLSPALISRRRGQRQVAVPANVSSPFEALCPALPSRDLGTTKPPADSCAPSSYVAKSAPPPGSVASRPTVSPPPAVASTSTAPTPPVAPQQLTPPAASPKAPAAAAAKAAPTRASSSVVRLTPNELVNRAVALPGVGGVLITLLDGLMVANRLQPKLDAEALAAFVPQIFGRVSQCTKEMHMGDLMDLNFTVGNVAWKILRVNGIFFAAFGQERKPLPVAELAGLAAEMDFKTKQAP